MKLLRCYNGSSSECGEGESKKNVKICGKFVVVVVLVAGLIGKGEGGLPLNKPCGDLECQALEFCHKIDETCKPCQDICEDDRHNYDQNRCFQDCQDYIHDVRYSKLQNSTILELQRIEMEEKYKKLEDDVFTLKIIVCVCVILILLVVAVLAAFLVYFWKLLHPTEPSNPEEKPKLGSNKTTTPSNSVELPTVYNNRYGVATPTPETSPNSGMSASPADTSVSTFTPIVPPGYNGGRKLSETLRNSPETVTTTLTSNASTIAGNQFPKMNGAPATSPAKSVAGPPKTNRFRREPSESTLPDNCAYDNLSMSPVHQIHYSHHV